MRALAVLLFLLAAPAFAGDWVGTITGTSSTNNLTTAVPFALKAMPNGATRPHSVQCDVAVYMRSGAGSGTTVTSTNGRLIPAGAIFDFKRFPDTHTVIAILPVLGTFTCQVHWEMEGP